MEFGQWLTILQPGLDLQSMAGRIEEIATAVDGRARYAGCKQGKEYKEDRARWSLGQW